MVPPHFFLCGYKVRRIHEALRLEMNWLDYDVYRDCEQNQPLWTTLHLYEVVNLDDLLNVTKVSFFGDYLKCKRNVIECALSMYHHSCVFSLSPSSLTHSTQRRSSSSLRIQTWICHRSLFWALKLNPNSATLAPRLKVLTSLLSHSR